MPDLALAVEVLHLLGGVARHGGILTLGTSGRGDDAQRTLGQWVADTLCAGRSKK